MFMAWPKKAKDSGNKITHNYSLAAQPTFFRAFAQSHSHFSCGKGLTVICVASYTKGNKGGEMEEEKKVSQVSFRLTSEEHHKLKILAATERKTIKNLVFEALDKLFPNWRKEK